MNGRARAVFVPGLIEGAAFEVEADRALDRDTARVSSAVRRRSLGRSEFIALE